MPRTKVLIVDGHPDVVEAIRAYVVRQGFEPVCAGGGREGIQKFFECGPQVVVLRDSMPGLNGWDTARRIRAMSDVPILFISDRADKVSLERSLRLGDDYMPPPWNWERLSARLAALLRRRSARIQSWRVYDNGDLQIDFARRQVTKRGKPVHLTDTEFQLLSYFVRNPNRVLRYEELLEHVWGDIYPETKSHVSLYVRYLRSKIEDDPSLPAYVHTEWGLGYSFRPHASGAA